MHSIGKVKCTDYYLLQEKPHLFPIDDASDGVDVDEANDIVNKSAARHTESLSVCALAHINRRLIRN